MTANTIEARKFRGSEDIPAEAVEWMKTPGGADYCLLSVNAEDDHAPMVSFVNMPAGYMSAPHSHHTDYLEFVLDGELTVGKRTYRKGDVRTVKQGVGYGPLAAGPEGCRALIVFRDGSGRGITPLGGEG